MSIGYYKNTDGGGSKYITIKTKSRFFKLFRVYSNLANIGAFHESLILVNRIQAWTEKENLSSCVYFHLLQTTSQKKI